MILYALGLILTVWMLYDCWKNEREAYWYFLILGTGGIGALIYFVTQYFRGSRVEVNLWRKLSLGRQIRELRDRAHHLRTGPTFEMLGDACYRSQRLKEAAEAYREALRLQPDLFDAQVRLGYVLVELDQVDEAWPLLGKAYQQKPEYDGGHLIWKLARCQFRRGKLEDARNLYAYFLTKQTYSEARIEYAHVLYMLKEPEKAEETLRELLHEIEFSPRYARARERPWARAAKRLLRTAAAQR